MLYSESFDKIYIGYSGSLEQRVTSHNDVRNKGWTKRYQPWILIYSEEFTSKSEAIKREEELKSYQGRLWVREKLIPKL